MTFGSSKMVHTRYYFSKIVSSSTIYYKFISYICLQHEWIIPLKRMIECLLYFIFYFLIVNISPLLPTIMSNNQNYTTCIWLNRIRFWVIMFINIDYFARLFGPRRAWIFPIKTGIEILYERNTFIGVLI